MIQEERRRFPRYYAPASLMAVAEFPPKRQYRLNVKDISVDGLCFVTQVDLSRENVFSLSFEVTTRGGAAARITTLASILWHIHDKETSLYTAGAQFLGLSDSKQKLLQDFLETLEPKSND